MLRVEIGNLMGEAEAFFNIGACAIELINYQVRFAIDNFVGTIFFTEENSLRKLP